MFALPSRLKWLDPTPLLQALEGGVKGSMLDEQPVLGGLLNGAPDTLPVLRAEDQRPQDQQVERSLQEFQSFSFLLGRHITQVSTFWVGCQPNKSRRTTSVAMVPLGK
jgi:hypothetical protein